MDTKENKTIKFIIISILIITVISLTGFAFARYITRLNGGATADIAKWSFKVNGKTDENFVIDLANTRTGLTQEAEVQEGYIGPGTAGAFQLELDATGSEASLEYNINMNVDYSNNQVFPKNLIFYSDSEMQNAIYHTDNNINLNGFIGWNDNSKVHTKTIYWKWDYETGSTQTEKDNNDIADSYWMGKPITLLMNVTAKQVTENPTTGQYSVTFDANGGTLQGYGNASTATKQVTYGEAYGTLPTPTREGYTFKGWNGKNLVDINKEELRHATIVDSKLILDSSEVVGNLPYGAIQVQTMNNYTFLNNLYESYETGNKTIIFEKNATFNKIKIKISTTSGDALMYIDVDKLQNGVSYTLSFNLEKLDKNIPRGVISKIQLEEGNMETTYEPYIILSSTPVTQRKNHILTAIWEPA